MYGTNLGVVNVDGVDEMWAELSMMRGSEVVTDESRLRLQALLVSVCWWMEMWRCVPSLGCGR